MNFRGGSIGAIPTPAHLWNNLRQTFSLGLSRGVGIRCSSFCFGVCCSFSAGHWRC